LTAAILAKPKILVMDEATASVDAAADDRIAEILKNSFKDTTVLAIAHRLASIADYDRVLVLDQGRIAECDHPYKLLQNEDSMFSNLVEATGSLQAEEIKRIAFEAYSK